ncbi:MAG: hypothetical protein JNN15_16755 [Blastocatellia bacterium]|nr:hypothetical protein [Blastocatellia bacterium]
MKISIKYLFVFFLLVATVTGLATAQENDKRKLTTIQKTSVENLEIKYLNLPWGETTFGYIENGGNDYYSTRTWPVAHLKLSTKAVYGTRLLTPGDYMFVITPKNGKRRPKMTLSLSAFKPDENGTFLTPGDVFTDTPIGRLISRKPISFVKGAPFHDAMKIELAQNNQVVDIKIHYGDRLLVEKLTLK